MHDDDLTRADIHRLYKWGRKAVADIEAEGKKATLERVRRRLAAEALAHDPMADLESFDVVERDDGPW